MVNKLSLEFLKKLGISAQLTALKKLGTSNYNAGVNKLNKEISAKDLEGTLEDFLKTDLGTILEAQDMDSLFKLIDADGDGTISEEEAKELGQAGSEGEGIDDEDIKAIMMAAEKYVVENDNTDRSKITTTDGKIGNLVDVSELPEGYSVSGGGKIYDSHFRLIGETRTLNRDINNDGIKEDVISYYIYEEDPVRQVPESELPRDEKGEIAYEIISGKIYTKDFDLIGYVVFTDYNINGKKGTNAEYFLYEDKPAPVSTEEDVSRYKYQVSENDIPYDAYIMDNKILNSQGFQIGRIEEITIDNVQSGKSGTVKKFFLSYNPATNTSSSASSSGSASSSSGSSGSSSGTTDSTATNENKTVPKITPKVLSRDSFTTVDGTKGNIVNVSDLPQGYSVGGDGIIYDRNFRKIGETRTVEKDYDGDGIKDNVISYYLYETDPVEKVSESQLPRDEKGKKAYEIISGKIYTKDYDLIGYVVFTDYNINGEKGTNAEYFLYKEKEEEVEEPDNNPKYQVTESQLPSDAYIANNKIYNADGFQIGIITETPIKDSSTGKTSIIKRYYFYE